MTEGDLKVLAPGGALPPLERFLREARGAAVAPFAPERVALLAALSQDLLGHPRLRRDPAGAALGFWLRRANLAALEADFRASPRAARRVAAGLVLHITPANVDTLFLYSWALSFLAGNANIVRLTTRTTALIDDLLACVRDRFATASTGGSNWFVTYPREAEDITEALSLACDTRIVWGGDETVERLRAVRLNPHAAERCFASKQSLAVIATSAYRHGDEAARDRVAEGMAADVTPFGQMACSSPQEVFWVGDEANAPAAIADLHGRLEKAIAARLGAADPSWSVRRINFAFEAAAGGAVRILHAAHTTQVLEGSEPFAGESCGAGLLRHHPVATLDAVLSRLDRSRQTVTYFGVDAGDLDRFALRAARAGVDRLVPIGRALDFGPLWDGYDLWGDVTRTISVI